MAVVGKDILAIGDTHYTFTFRVLKDGLFRTEIPDELQQYCRGEHIQRRYVKDRRLFEITADTKDDLINHLKDLQNTVKQSNTVTRKVILYKIEVDCTVEGPISMTEYYDPAKHEGNEKVVILKPSTYFKDGMKIFITAAVAIESEITAIDGQKRYNYSTRDVEHDERLPSGLNSNSLQAGRMSRNEPASNLLEWTQERHDFFVRIYEAMGQLAWQLHNLAKPGNIDRAIESGLKFLENKGENDAE